MPYSQQQWQKVQSELRALKRQNQILKQENSTLKHQFQLQRKKNNQNQLNISQSPTFQSNQDMKIAYNNCQHKLFKLPSIQNFDYFLSAQTPENINKTQTQTQQSQNLKVRLTKSSCHLNQHNTNDKQQQQKIQDLPTRSMVETQELKIPKLQKQTSVQIKIKKQNYLQKKSSATSQLQKILNKINDSQIPLIQDVCVFGPDHFNFQNLQFNSDKLLIVDPILYYPKDNLQYYQYANYFYPKLVHVKSIQQKNQILQINKIIFKNNKKTQAQNWSAYVFQGLDKHPLKQRNQLLEKVNPSKWLCGLVIDFPDFIVKDNQKKYQIKANIQLFSPLKKNKLTLDTQKLKQQTLKMQNVSLRFIQFQNQKQHVYKSNFSLCVFTYFPFINFLKKLMTNIFDEVKLKRIQQFPKVKKYKDCDVFYFIKQLQNSLAKIMKNLSLPSNIPRIGKLLQIDVNQIKLNLNLEESSIYYQMFDGWAYKMLRRINKEVLYEIYYAVMLQKTVYFVCQNTSTLTFMILIFTFMLTHPFAFPYPVISLAFIDQLLQTPFTSIIGINKSQKQLQQMQQDSFVDLSQKYVLYIGEQEVRLNFKGKSKTPKSQKLKKIFSKYYKKAQTYSLGDIFWKKSQNSCEQQKQQNKSAVNMFLKLQLFLYKQLLQYLPNKLLIQSQIEFNKEINQNKNQSQNLNLNRSQMISQMLEKINKFYVCSHNQSKDQFIEAFIQSQIYVIYLTEQYQIK